jgi:hypothetical protein
MYDRSAACQTRADSTNCFQENRHARFDVDGSERILLAWMYDPSRKSNEATSRDESHDR